MMQIDAKGANSTNNKAVPDASISNIRSLIHLLFYSR